MTVEVWSLSVREMEIEGSSVIAPLVPHIFASSREGSSNAALEALK